MITLNDIVAEYKLARQGETRRTLRLLIVKSLSPKTRKVLDYIDDHADVTSREVADALSMSIHNVCNRIHMLRECGLLYTELQDDGKTFSYSLYHGGVSL